MTCKDEHKYDDIIHLPHPVSKNHPPMSLSNRAAQFAPFAALTGHGAAIREAARLTDSFIELDESKIEQIDEILQWIRKQLLEHPNQPPEIEITYFRPDLNKAGGSYVTVCGQAKKLDEYNRQMILMDGTVIPLEHLYSLSL